MLECGHVEVQAQWPQKASLGRCLLSLECSEGASYEVVWKKTILVRRNSKYKGPEIRMHFFV